MLNSVKSYFLTYDCLLVLGKLLQKGIYFTKMSSNGYSRRSLAFLLTILAIPALSQPLMMRCFPSLFVRWLYKGSRAMLHELVSEQKASSQLKCCHWNFRVLYFASEFLLNTRLCSLSWTIWLLCWLLDQEIDGSWHVARTDNLNIQRSQSIGLHWFSAPCNHPSVNIFFVKLNFAAHSWNKWE